jgi:uncharacterized protein YjdB
MARFIRTLTTLCAVLLVVCLVFPLFAFSGKAGAGSGIKVKINEKFLSLSQPPVRIKDGTTLLPFRPIYEFLGATISWDKNTSTVSASKGGIKVALQVKEGMAIVNDEKVILNISSRIENGTTMVPAWFFAESLGAQVDWDAEQQVVNISLASVSGISLEKGELTLEQGETEMIAATVFPENAVNKNIKWSSTLPSVARVNKASNTGAVISAINPGTAIIIATTEEGNHASTCRVTVEQAYTPVTGVYLNRTIKTLWEGEAPWTLTAKIYPETATNKNITWKSSKAGVASVHKQTANRCAIVPLKKGKTVVSATTEDGEYVDVCTITVLSADED